MSIGIVVVGPGLIGKKHIALIKANPDTHLAAIVAPDHEINHQLAKAEDVDLFYSLAHCAKSVVVDAVIISSPNEFHYGQAHWCIENYIPVLIEKPVTPGVDEARDLVDLVQIQGKN